jgi:hypothetical protein
MTGSGRIPVTGRTLGSVAWDWYAAISEPPPELPSSTTCSAPACSRSQRTPTPISASAWSRRKCASLPRNLVFQPRNPKPRSAMKLAR